MTKARTEGEKLRARRSRNGSSQDIGHDRPSEPRSEPLGPTEEARLHGDYRQGDSGSTAVYTNSHVNALGKLAAHSAITKCQHAAGLCFERTWTAVNGSASPSRDSTIPAIGGTCHETDEQAARYAKNRARLNAIIKLTGPGRYSLLVRVCVFGESIGMNRGAGKGRALELRAMLRKSLDECATVYGIQEEAA